MSLWGVREFGGVKSGRRRNPVVGRRVVERSREREEGWERRGKMGDKEDGGEERKREQS